MSTRAIASVTCDGHWLSQSGNLLAILLLLLASVMVLAEQGGAPGTMARYQEVFRRELMNEYSESWRQPPAEESGWRENSGGGRDAANGRRIQWGYDPVREHQRNQSELQGQQNPSNLRRPAPSEVMELSF